MLAKMTVKNQLTLPKAVVTRFTGVEYFDVSTDGASIILRPLQRSRAEEVRLRLAAQLDQHTGKFRWFGRCHAGCCGARNIG